MKFFALATILASTNAVRVAEETAPVELAESIDEYDTHTYQYPIESQNFNGILGMLGTPTSMTTQLHTMFNQIHFNERVMRQIREIVNDTPELVETLCADGNG